MTAGIYETFFWKTKRKWPYDSIINEDTNTSTTNL